MKMTRNSREGVNGSYKETTSQTISIETANKYLLPRPAINGGNHIGNGTFVAVSIKRPVLRVTPLHVHQLCCHESKLSNVSSGAWVIGQTAVNYRLAGPTRSPPMFWSLRR
ncbi:MAG: hypothetical protein ACLU38_10605 [Dysosmobacter sp.]